MASVQHLSVVTPVLPSSYSPAASTSRLSPPHPAGHRSLLPVGPAYLNHLKLALHHSHSFDALDKHLAEEQERLRSLNGDGNGQEDDLGVGDEPESEELLSLDPKEWKKHDYYAVLGLSHLRYKATPEQIKIAHRKKVLKHHPDKKASSAPQPTSAFLAGVNQNTNDDAFFKCIQKAHEVLTNSEKRRQFDSVDPDFIEQEEEIPTASDFKKKDLDFFKAFTPVFELHSRFSRKQPVPGLGGVDASKEEVEGFYDFWYNFDSWRSFEWWDKEVNEGSDNRDDKRYTEKKNKTERARRKKEDTAKLRALVDLTLSLDPRIKRIKQEEKAAREAKKRGAAPNGPVKKTKQQEEEEKKRVEEEAKKKEEEEKVARAEAKKAKAAAANAAKKARRQARNAGDDAPAV
ncbi:DnaJ domain-containing protein [Cyathus striatus]|nr:DnaJ domain-containing protein [Cyathus striatus]